MAADPSHSHTVLTFQIRQLEKSMIMRSFSVLLVALGVFAANAADAKQRLRMRGLQTAKRVNQTIFQGTQVTDANEIPSYALLCFGSSGSSDSCNDCGGVLITSEFEDTTKDSYW